MALELAAGPHVRDLKWAEATWRQIRPRYVLPEGERVTAEDVGSALEHAAGAGAKSIVTKASPRRGSMGKTWSPPKRPLHADVMSLGFAGAKEAGRGGSSVTLDDVGLEVCRGDLADICRTFTDSDDAPATPSVCSPGAGPFSKHYKASARKLHQQRVFDALRTRDHYKVYAGVNMSEQATLWHSATIDRVMDEARARVIEMPATDQMPAGTPFTYGMVFDLLAAQDVAAYIYGGALRDVFMNGPAVAEDIDVLFACDAQRLAELGAAKYGWVKGVHYKFKRFENSDQERLDYISVGDHTSSAPSGREKFSGHKLDSNCAGEFTFNCMLYDLGRKLLIDATGQGIGDAVRKVMRIPYDGGRPGEWDAWSQNCDRLPGMSSLRFFNFRSRGWSAPAEVVTHIVWWLVWTGEGREARPALASLHTTEAPPAATTLADTIRVFLKRKILKLDAGALARAPPAAADAAFAKAAAKLAAFRAQMVEDFNAAFRHAGLPEAAGDDGEGAPSDTPGASWFDEHVQGVADAMLAEQREKLYGGAQ